MRRRQDELDADDVRVAVVTFEADFMAQAYVEDTGLPWPLLIDRDRAIYRAYGMGRSRRREVWSTSTAVAYGRALLRGHKLRRSDADVYQRGGDVLVDPDGIVRLHHVGDSPADRPPVERILAVIGEATS